MNDLKDPKQRVRVGQVYRHAWDHRRVKITKLASPSPSGARRWHACPVGVRAGVRTTTLSESTLAGDWALIGEVKP